MILRCLLFLACTATRILADVQFTSPDAGGTEAGGSKVDIEWKDSGDDPKLSDLVSYQLFLCAGGNDAASYIQLSVLVANGDFKDGNKASVQIPAAIGGTDKNAYFLKMISVATGGTVNNYSPRFSLSGMTGVFPPTVQAGLKTVKGTAGPDTENNIQSTQQNNAAGNAPAAADGAYGQAYTLQSGPTRYAPMPPMPVSKISANKQSRLHPTSSISGFAKTHLPIPVAKTTMTQSQTFVTTSIENTAADAGMPTDAAMQKFLNRWKD